MCLDKWIIQILVRFRCTSLYLMNSFFICCSILKFNESIVDVHLSTANVCCLALPFTPCFDTHISSVDIDVMPTAIACCLPSAITATIEPLSTRVILAPGDVRPGHMILAPLRTNLIAPLSTCICGAINGSEIWKFETYNTINFPY